MIAVSPVAGALFSLFGLWLLSWVVRRSGGLRTTSLKGPPGKSLIFGLSRYIHTSGDSGALFEQWEKEYGPAYSVPFAFGSSRIILFDPKAIAHFYSQDTFTYVRTWIGRRAVERLMGRGVLWAEDENHRRQRRTLTPAFNTAAVRQLTSIFYDSAYKVKVAWDALIDSAPSGQATIDVQGWMNHVSLDSIGIAGFSHDFRTLHGEVPEVVVVFDSFFKLKPSFVHVLTFLLAPVFPILGYIPTSTRTLTSRLNKSLETIATKLLLNSKKLGDQEFQDRSAIGLLLKAESTDSETRLSLEEVLGQMKNLLIAGYETTSVSLTWALVELCQNLEVQSKLRKELSQFSNVDPTWNQLTTSLPYLDAVIHETLRLHPPVRETTRVATTDDTIPLGNPIETLNGEIVHTLSIAKGTTVTVSVRAVNYSETFWGPDAKEFKPERWLSEKGISGSSEIQGHRHLLTFSDGPRTCLGKGFALAEFKAVLCTLIKNFSFEMKEGTEIESVNGVLPRPKVVGEEGAKVPLLVRCVG